MADMDVNNFEQTKSGAVGTSSIHGTKVCLAILHFVTHKQAPSAWLWSGNLQPYERSTTTSLPHAGLVLTTSQVSDPSARPIEEGTGTIPSDSLAAESIRAGGDFAANQDQTAGISGQSSKGFTGRTTDTSGARKIEGDATGEDPSTTQAALDADVKHGKSAGVGPTYNADSTTKGTSSSADVAPTAHWDNVDERVYQPKGENLKEGGGGGGRLVVLVYVFFRSGSVNFDLAAPHGPFGTGRVQKRGQAYSGPP